ncbi:MAG: DUF6908 domain-containing protein [Promethearchaeota archaeon]
MIYQDIYRLLSEIVDLSTLRDQGYLKYKSSGFMDLNVDFLMEDEQKREIIALSHYYKQNGDMIADPDMELRIDYAWDNPTCEALSYQDYFGYKKVYNEIGNFDPKIKADLNEFLLIWLKNLKNQQFKLFI